MEIHNGLILLSSLATNLKLVSSERCFKFLFSIFFNLKNFPRNLVLLRHSNLSLSAYFVAVSNVEILGYSNQLLLASFFKPSNFSHAFLLPCVIQQTSIQHTSI